MLTLHSHTHCQAVRTKAKTKAWQRVCLFPYSTEPTDKLTDEKEARCPNSRLPQRGLTCNIEVLCFYQTFVQGESEVLLNPPLRQAANRWAQLKRTSCN